METPTCSVDGCTKHYTRWQRHGDPLAVSRNPPMQPTDTAKHCPRCGNKKPLDQFGRRPNGKPTGYCIECTKAYDTKYAESERGREQRRLARAKWNDGNHEYFLMYRYGITRSQYDEMLESQSGRCAICGATEPGGRDKVWCVDHCHNSNKVRGLLCSPCNRGLGQFRDDVERLRSAVAYLERHA